MYVIIVIIIIITIRKMTIKMICIVFYQLTIELNEIKYYKNFISLKS